MLRAGISTVDKISLLKTTNVSQKMLQQQKMLKNFQKIYIGWAIIPTLLVIFPTVSQHSCCPANFFLKFLCCRKEMLKKLSKI